MINHFLTRNPENEPVCSCGFRPAILDEPAPVGKQWKAKTAVLDHVHAMGDSVEEPNNMVRFAEDVLGITLAPWQVKVLRSPDAPFVLRAARYPRAGVRQTEDGKWKLTAWDGPDIAHVVIDEPAFDDRVQAFEYGHMTIGACWVSGTSLNGLAVD